MECSLTTHIIPPCTGTANVSTYLKNGQCGKEFYQNSHDPKTRVVCVVHPQSLTSITEQKNKPMKDKHTHTHNYNSKPTETQKYYNNIRKKEPCITMLPPYAWHGFGILPLTKCKHNLELSHLKLFPIPQQAFLPMLTKLERLLTHLTQDRFDTKVWQYVNNQGHYVQAGTTLCSHHSPLAHALYDK